MIIVMEARWGNNKQDEFKDKYERIMKNQINIK